MHGVVLKIAILRIVHKYCKATNFNVLLISAKLVNEIKHYML